MKKLLDIVKEKFDQADLFYMAQESSSVTISNGKLDSIETSKEGGYALRTYKDGKTGFAYANKIDNPEQILESLDVSMAGAVAEDVKLPSPVKLPALNTYSKKIAEVNSATLNESCEKMYAYLKEQVDTEIDTMGWKEIYERRLMNSNGVDYCDKGSSSGLYASMSYPGGAGSMGISFESKGIVDYSEYRLDKLVTLYKAGESVVKPEGGKMKVLFMPSTVFSLIWRLSAAASANAVDQGTSVLKDKIGEKIFSDKITIYNNPLNDERPEAAAFDGEGLENKKRFIVEKGIFKSFYGNLKYCKKIGIEPTGTGKRGSWSAKPTGSLGDLYLEPGFQSFEELVSSMDKGVIVFGILGAHSGNIPNGDFSLGINPGLYVEDGKIVGRVKDAMVAGNVYDVMKNVIAVGREAVPSTMITTPPILIDNMNVSIKA